MVERKPWWVHAVYPGGEIPEERPGGGGGRLGAKDVLAEYLYDVLPTTTVGIGTHNKGTLLHYAVPDAFGINRTATTHVASAVTTMSDALAEKTGVARGGGSERSERQSWLVLKPNGGQTYDMESREWGWHGGETRL